MASKTYLVTGTWVNKDTGKPLSSVCQVTGGISKLGHKYQFADTKAYEPPIEGTYPVGTILNADVNFTVGDNGAVAQANTAGIQVTPPKVITRTTGTTKA
jgi:hypothetical protein